MNGVGIFAFQWMWGINHTLGWKALSFFCLQSFLCSSSLPLHLLATLHVLNTLYLVEPTHQSEAADPTGAYHLKEFACLRRQAEWTKFEPTPPHCFSAAPIAHCVFWITAVSQDWWCYLRSWGSVQGWALVGSLLEGLLNFTQKFWLEIWFSCWKHWNTVFMFMRNLPSRFLLLSWDLL